MFSISSEPRHAARMAAGCGGPLLAAAALLALLPGCSGLSMSPPDQFLVVADSAREIKAVSPDSTLLWVRRFEDEHAGGLDFWSEALLDDLVKNRGYRLLEKNTLLLNSGTSGMEYLFEATARGVRQKYLLCLFVRRAGSSSTICTAEYVGPAEEFDGRIEAVRGAVRSLVF